MTIEQRLKKYDRFRNELEADICTLSYMLNLNLIEPDGDLTQLNELLKRLQGSLDFVCDERIEERMAHARMRFRQLAALDYLIRICPRDERIALQSLFVDKLSWDETSSRLNVSRVTLHRIRRRALDRLEEKMKADLPLSHLFQVSDDWN